MRAFEYGLLALMVVCLAYLGLSAIAGMTTSALNESANLIANH